MNIVGSPKFSAGVRRRRRLGVIGVAASLAMGGTVIVGGGEVSAEKVLAYAIVDCTRPGSQFVLADGNDEDTTAEAIDDAGTVVLTLQRHRTVDSPPVSSSFVVFSVPSGTDYAAVRFANKSSSVTQTVPPVEEPCTPSPISISTGDPGPGPVPIKPARLLDTRTRRPAGQGATAVGGGTTVEVATLGAGGIPSDAGAVLLNVASVRPESVGHLRVFPCGTPLPKTSSLNFVAGETRAANVFVKPGANGKVCIYTSTRTDLLADAQAYVPKGSQPVAITPVRVVDTRVGAPVDGPGLLPKAKVKGRIGLDMSRVAGVAGIPADAKSFVVNVTATNAAAGGYVTVNDCYPESGSKEAKSSTLNFMPGRATANMAFTVDDDLFGVCMYTNQPVDLIVDVTGYSVSPYASPRVINRGLRMFDTRDTPDGQPGTSDDFYSGPPRLKAGEETSIEIGGRASSEAYVPRRTWVVLNVTAVRPAANGYVTVYECGKRPSTSNLNVRAGETVANTAIVQLDSSDKVCMYSSVDTDLVLDVPAFGPFTNRPSVRWGIVELTKSYPSYPLVMDDGVPPYTVSGNLPAPISISIDENGVISYSGDPTAWAYYDGTLTVTDGKGRIGFFELAISWLPDGAEKLGPLPLV